LHRSTSKSGGKGAKNLIFRVHSQETVTRWNRSSMRELLTRFRSHLATTVSCTSHRVSWPIWKKERSMHFANCQTEISSPLFSWRLVSGVQPEFCTRMTRCMCRLEG
jgi:hypothetical protein